jgi:hypothetical protein
MGAGPFFHGGTRKLRRGGILLPPAKSGAPSSADFGADGVCRRDRVYVTDDLDQARMFAILAPPKGHGSVYEVEPLGDLEPDPDFRGETGSWQVSMARVLRVVERRVTEVFGCGMAEVAAICSSDGDPYPPANRLLVAPPHHGEASQ